MIEFLLLIAGMAGLWLGSEILIRGATALTDRYHLSDAAFGMLVLALGTDLPELFVAVDASIRSLNGFDYSGIVIGSAIGSAIGQFGLVFGAAGFIGFQAMRRRYLPRNLFFLIGSIVVVGLLSWDGQLSRLDGLLITAFYASYLYIVISRRHLSPDATVRPSTVESWRAWLWLAGGLVLLLLAAELTVASAISFGKVVGLSNVAVSAIIIGMGSSLPEMSVSFAALLKNRGALSVGNLIGSNILDTLLVPGLAAVISPLTVPRVVLLIDLPVLLLVTLLVIGFLYVSRRGVRKTEAVILLGLYAGYAIVRLTGPGS
ncbi:MAG: sodium:calcium antiporter [Gammaproteobacteria bacterium]|nr:sodium:calcium antiporter [Gammaproteobacteria bacterium]